MLLTVISIIISAILFLQGWLVDPFTVQKVVLGFVSIVCALWVWKSGIPQQLFSGYQNLEKLRTAQRDEVIRERDAATTELKEYKEENKSLRREVITLMDLRREDSDTIRGLKEELRKCRDK
jgi:hypothetical protein